MKKKLTQIEKEIVYYLLTRASSAEIAKKLGGNPYTIIRHLDCYFNNKLYYNKLARKFNLKDFD